MYPEVIKNLSKRLEGTNRFEHANVPGPLSERSNHSKLENDASSKLIVEAFSQAALSVNGSTRLIHLNYACFCLIGIFRAMLYNQNPTAEGKGAFASGSQQRHLVETEPAA